MQEQERRKTWTDSCVSKEEEIDPPLSIHILSHRSLLLNLNPDTLEILIWFVQALAFSISLLWAMFYQQHHRHNASIDDELISSPYTSTRFRVSERYFQSQKNWLHTIRRGMRVGRARFGRRAFWEMVVWRDWSWGWCFGMLMRVGFEVDEWKRGLKEFGFGAEVDFDDSREEDHWLLTWWISTIRGSPPAWTTLNHVWIHLDRLLIWIDGNSNWEIAWNFWCLDPPPPSLLYHQIRFLLLHHGPISSDSFQCSCDLIFNLIKSSFGNQFIPKLHHLVLPQPCSSLSLPSHLALSLSTSPLCSPLSFWSIPWPFSHKGRNQLPLWWQIGRWQHVEFWDLFCWMALEPKYDEWFDDLCWFPRRDLKNWNIEICLGSSAFPLFVSA